LSPAAPLIWRKRQAFHSLLQKFLPDSMRSSWKRMSCPCGAIEHDAEAQAVGAVLRDEVERIGRVAE
jgi:hypothetical protein